MSDVSQGPGWWLASDGRWYPPETHPQYREPEHVQAPVTVGGPAGGTGPAEPLGVHVVEPAGLHVAEPGSHFAAEPVGPQVTEPVGLHVAEPTGLHMTEPVGAFGEPGGAFGEPVGAVGEPAGPWQVSAPGPQAGAEGKWGPTSVTRCHHRVVGPGLVVLGLAVVVWGVGAAFNAVAAVNAGFPHNEQIGAWLTAAGILAVGLVLAIVGLLYRRG